MNPGDVTVPLLVPHALAEKLQSGDWMHGDSRSADSADVLAERAESLADKAGEAADSASGVADQREAARMSAPIRRLAQGGGQAPGRLAARGARSHGGLAPAQVASGIMLLVLDNYDSFTYNLVQYAGELGADPVVHRNDALSVDDALALQPRHRDLARACTPREAGISVPLVRAAAAAGVPLLGVCLGHQAIGEAFGGRVVRADRLMHGKTTMVVAHRTRAVRRPALAVRGDALPLARGLPAWAFRPSSR